MEPDAPGGYAMRYRKLDANSDMQFGHGSGDFWHDQPEAVGQSVKTRLLLFAGEWFLDTSEGTPWGGFPLNDLVVQQGRILGVHTQLSRDAAIRERILTTNGVVNILDYDSTVDPDTRAFVVNATIDTVYGRAFALNISQVGMTQPSIHVAIVPQPTMVAQNWPAPPLLRRLPQR
jgi:hypothetical protein